MAKAVPGSVRFLMDGLFPPCVQTVLPSGSHTPAAACAAARGASVAGAVHPSHHPAPAQNTPGTTQGQDVTTPDSGAVVSLAMGCGSIPSPWDDCNGDGIGLSIQALAPFFRTQCHCVGPQTKRAWAWTRTQQTVEYSHTDAARYK